MILAGQQRLMEVEYTPHLLIKAESSIESSKQEEKYHSLVFQNPRNVAYTATVRLSVCSPDSQLQAQIFDDELSYKELDGKLKVQDGGAGDWTSHKIFFDIDGEKKFTFGLIHRAYRSNFEEKFEDGFRWLRIDATLEPELEMVEPRTIKRLFSVAGDSTVFSPYSFEEARTEN